MSDAVATGTALAVAYAAVKVLGVLIGRMSNGRGSNGRNGMIKRIYEVVTKTDRDESPMIYGAAGHRALLVEMQKMNGHLENINRGVRNGGHRGGDGE